MSSPLNSPLMNFRNAVFRAESATFNARLIATDYMCSLTSEQAEKRTRIAKQKLKIVKMNEILAKMLAALDKEIDGAK